MHIVMFSINPLFSGQVMGGAPKHLQNIAIHLGSLGHTVTVLCTRTVDNTQAFKWQQNVTVHPILRFKQPFPQPYAIPAYDMAAAVQDVGDYLARADRFYMHDGEFLFPYVYQDVPTVVSLRDNVYPETLIGGFLAQSAKLVLISDYSRQYFLHTMGRFFPQFDARVEVIHNGLDWQKFQPTPPKEILDIIPVDLTQQALVLHPHRPEESKGIRHTIRVVDLLVNTYGLKHVVGLAPRWLDLQLTADLREFYDQILADIETRGLKEHFIFHDWIPQGLMPQYFSMGAVTLSMGNFVESFGNAVYESMGCGTPSIAARISTHRELLPDHLIDKVNYGDVEAAAAIAAQVIGDGRRTSDDTLAYLHQHYSIDHQLDHYAEVILNAQKSAPLAYVHPQLDANTRYQLAPWCFVADEQRIYHDFYADYREDEAVVAVCAAYPDGFRQVDVPHINLDDLYQAGFLVPLTNA